MGLQGTLTRKSFIADHAVKLPTNTTLKFEMPFQVTLAFIFATTVVRTEVEMRQAA